MNPLFDYKNHTKIATLESSLTRPLWSVVIPTYNCANYLRETLTSVFQQNYPSDQMEIIVVDDCSDKDNPKSVVDDFEPGRIVFYQHDKNVGKSANYSKGISMSTGQYVHLLHGDDTVNDGFYQKIEKLFNDYPKAAAAFSRCNYINAESEITGETKSLSESDGILGNFQVQIATWQLIQPPSIVFKREIYESLGTYDLRLKYIEDWEFYVRAAIYFDFAYTPEKLANYRVFRENSSSQSIKGGKRMATLDQVVGIMDEYLPAKVKQEIRKTRNESIAIYLLNFIPRLVSTKDIKGLFITTRAFSKYNSSIHLWIRWFRFVVEYKKFLKPS